MGCCASTISNTTPSSKAPHTSNKYSSTKLNTSSSNGNSKSPPNLEEETVVKEVLSETPAAIPKKPPPPTLSTFQQQTRGQNSVVDSPFVKTSSPLLLPSPHFTKTRTTQLDNDKKLQNGAVYKKPYTAFPSDDTSDDLCSSLSESVSVSTTLTDKKDTTNNEFQEVMTRQRSPAKHKSRSFSDEVVRRDTTVGRSPGRRSEPSPVRARPGNGPGARKKDNWESSGRRSRSPVTRTDASRTNLGRTQSGRKTGKSPTRVGSGLGDRTRNVGGEGRGDGNGSGNKWPPTGNELLENPLVSMECFIFL